MNRNYKEAIKYVDLMSEQIQALEQQNTKLKEQLNTAICLLCSNKAKVMRWWDDDASMYVNALHVQELYGDETGQFSPEDNPYKAVLTGIDEYIEYMADNGS